MIILRRLYSALPPGSQVLITALNLKESVLEQALTGGSISATMTLNSAADRFSIDGPIGLLNIRMNLESRSEAGQLMVGDVQSDRGMKRKVNEDSGCLATLSYANPQGSARFSAAMVADGVGGLSAGEVASKIAVTSTMGAAVRGIRTSGGTDFSPILLAGFDAAEKRIERVASFTNKSLGSTLSVSIIQEHKIYAGYAGDTRIYLIKTKSKEIARLTKDHRLEQAGAPSNVITRALGSRNNSPDFTIPHDLQDNSLIVICSDGLHDLVSDEEILQRSLVADNPKNLCQELIAAANLQGGKDNITVAAISKK
jgi:protein phosphatase